MVRRELYRLFPLSANGGLTDLGNIIRGNTISDTYYALSTVVAELINRDILPIVIGGSQDLTYAMYLGYEKIGRIINLASIDPVFDIGESEEEINSQSYLSKIILHQPNYLFNYTNIGYQSYLVDQGGINLLRNLFFDFYRLGNIQADIEGVEPYVRNADMISVDISSVRASDAPGNGNLQPHGFYGEEMCRIMRYAGISDKVSSIGFFEFNPDYDRQNQTAKLVAQMVWYFLEGFYNRQHDYPQEGEKDYLKFTVTAKDFQDELFFYKSRRTDRWWMKVPFRTRNQAKYERHHMVPCSANDYETAMTSHIPDRWWQTYQKLM
jgi:arginase family enzyme